MLQALIYIRVEQCAQKDDTNTRNRVFYINSATSIDIKKSAEYISQSAKIVLPKRIIGNTYGVLNSRERGIEVTDKGSIIWGDEIKNPLRAAGNQLNRETGDEFVKNLDDAENNPLFMTGDMITVWTGYMIDDGAGDGSPFSKIKLYQQFVGYISIVNAANDIELICEDFMWYFKQLRLTNRHYTVDAKKDPREVGYDGLSHYVLDTLTRNPGTPNSLRVTSTKALSNKPAQYPITTINGMLLDALNNSINSNELEKKGIFPLIWRRGKDKKGEERKIPVICIDDNPVYKMENITVDTNASFFGFLELIKTNYGQSVYIWQQSLTYNWGISGFDRKWSGINNIPISKDSITDRLYPWIANYINFGWSRYVPDSIYTPQNYKFYLSGEDCYIIDHNLFWRRKEDYPTGAIVKAKNMFNVKDDGSVHTEGDPANTAQKTANGKNKLKQFTKSVHVGYFGGYSYTYLFNANVRFSRDGYVDGDPRSKFASSAKKNKDGLTDYEQMVKFGNEQLNKISYTGYTGSFVTLGYPFINIGDTVELVDPDYSERAGYYKVKAVDYHVGTGIGLQQEVHLGEQVNGPGGNVIFTNK